MPSIFPHRVSRANDAVPYTSERYDVRCQVDTFDCTVLGHKSERNPHDTLPRRLSDSGLVTVLGKFHILRATASPHS